METEVNRSRMVNPYLSFGINKNAFEAVLGGLAGLFK